MVCLFEKTLNIRQWIIPALAGRRECSFEHPNSGTCLKILEKPRDRLVERALDPQYYSSGEVLGDGCRKKAGHRTSSWGCLQWPCLGEQGLDGPGRFQHWRQLPILAPLVPGEDLPLSKKSLPQCILITPLLVETQCLIFSFQCIDCASLRYAIMKSDFNLRPFCLGWGLRTGTISGSFVSSKWARIRVLPAALPILSFAQINGLRAEHSVQGSFQP